MGDNKGHKIICMLNYFVSYILANGGIVALCSGNGGLEQTLQLFNVKYSKAGYTDRIGTSKCEPAVFWSLAANKVFKM